MRMPDLFPYAGLSALAIASLFVMTWLAALVRRDVSLVDRVWGFGFWCTATISLLCGPSRSALHWIFWGCLSLWSLRLSCFLTRRNWGKGEDARYVAMRIKNPHWFPVSSLITVFAFQALLNFLLSAPIQIAFAQPLPRNLWFAIGLLVFAIGFAFEFGADTQLTRFRRSAGSSGHVLDTGWFAHTRHPNYFGEACIWWGLWLCVSRSPAGFLSLFAPALMTFLLTRVSGVPMLERSLVARRPKYARYAERVPAFFPWPAGLQRPTPRRGIMALVAAAVTMVAIVLVWSTPSAWVPGAAEPWLRQIVEQPVRSFWGAACFLVACSAMAGYAQLVVLSARMRTLVVVGCLAMAAGCSAVAAVALGWHNARVLTLATYMDAIFIVALAIGVGAIAAQPTRANSLRALCAVLAGGALLVAVQLLLGQPAVLLPVVGGLWILVLVADGVHKLAGLAKCSKPAEMIA